MPEASPQFAPSQPDAMFVTGYAGWFDTPGKGRGCLALRDIPAGTVIDRNPVVIMPNIPLQEANAQNLIMENYLFRWGPEINQTAEQSACALGLISLCNHGASPNAELRQDPVHGLMELIARRAIRAGEEITIDYDVELWFDPA